ncbi:MAG: hypothetical protein IKS85_09435, partial [Lachnospiraceae bacterium]|nr:hypothetical protein [Lachnospiraceae bacterium]
LRGAMYSVAWRRNAMRSVDLSQAFIMDTACHGESVFVIPSAGASCKEGEQCSDWQEDMENGVLLLGDGEAPVISGWDGLETLFEQICDGEESLQLELTAWDELSGLDQFWLEAYQTNTGEYGIFHGENGRICVDVADNPFAFSGDVTLVAHATDHVGNLTTLEFTAREFSLSAEILRILPPHAPNFKRGESGILRVVVRGYADWLEIQFPEEFVRSDPSLHVILRYDVPTEVASEEVVFMVPLELMSDGDYVVSVRAHKGAEVLECMPELSTFRVTGSVLGEIRTRLR